jgi:hypothetical protein
MPRRRVTWQSKLNPNRASASTEGNCWLRPQTAVITATGIAPNANTVAVTNSAQAASVTKAWVSESPALNVCASTARKIQEIAQRNRIREQAGLPLLSVPSELRKIKNVEIAAASEEFADRHGESVWEEVLAPVREGRREPTWRPTGFMEGLGFQAQISKILRERFDLSQHHGQK